MKGTNSMFDIIIIGSGPAGLSAAIYAKRANLNVAVAEKEYEGTGQIAESGNVNNYLGLPNINGYDLGEKFREHAVSLDVEFIEKEVVQIEAVQNGEKEESAPSSRNLSASSNEEMPPAAFIFTPSPICTENSFISSKVAPAVPKPVDVLM